MYENISKIHREKAAFSCNCSGQISYYFLNYVTLVVTLQYFGADFIHIQLGVGCSLRAG